jgi:hypothetical protein
MRSFSSGSFPDIFTMMDSSQEKVMLQMIIPTVYSLSGKHDRHSIVIFVPSIQPCEIQDRRNQKPSSIIGLVNASDFL